MNSILTPILGWCLMCASTFAAEHPALPTKHTLRNIEGWSVRVDDRYLAGDSAAPVFLYFRQ